HMKHAVSAHAGRLVAWKLECERAFFKRNVLAQHSNGLDMDLDLRLLHYLEILGIGFLNGSATFESLSVRADVFAISRPEGGHGFSVAGVERLGERLC